MHLTVSGLPTPLGRTGPDWARVVKLCVESLGPSITDHTLGFIYAIEALAEDHQGGALGEGNRDDGRLCLQDGIPLRRSTNGNVSRSAVRLIPDYAYAPERSRDPGPRNSEMASLQQG